VFNIIEILERTSSWKEIILLLLFAFLLVSIFSMILIQFLPLKYKKYKKEIFLFFMIIALGLPFMGIVLILLMLTFGLSWATHRVSRPSYESIHFEEQISTFPMVYSKFHEGVLALDGHHKDKIRSDEKIKSLKILYDSHAQGNIGKIQKFLSDSSDETRLYAFALVSTFEKKLNGQIKELQKKIEYTHNLEYKERYKFELAQVYWQFIFHGVASEQLTSFYTEKIEFILKDIKENIPAFILLGKIKIFNHDYEEAEFYFNKALDLGVSSKAIATFLAEIKYGQRKYNDVSKYILSEEFDIDLRLKPLIQVWRDV